MTDEPETCSFCSQDLAAEDQLFEAHDCVVKQAKEIERRDELLTRWDHCLSSFYGNNIIDSVRRAMRCVRYGVEIPKPWETRPDYSNEMVKLKAENERLTAEVTTMRIALQAIAKHYTPNWKPGDTHQTTQRLSGIAHDALLVAAIRGSDTASGSQPMYMGIDLAKLGSDTTGFICTRCKAMMLTIEEADQHTCADSSPECECDCGRENNLSGEDHHPGCAVFDSDESEHGQ